MATPLLNLLGNGLVLHTEDIALTKKLQDENSRNDITTNARNGTKRYGLYELKIAVWNVRGICNKETELGRELKAANTDIAIIPETKKKLKGTKDLRDYVLLYSGVNRNKRAAAGIGIIVQQKWNNKTDSYSFVNERILTLRYTTTRGYMTILGVYAPEEGKTDETTKFYWDLQSEIDKTNKNDFLIVAGDLNAKIGNTPITGIVGNNGEPIINNNGRSLLNFAATNDLKITNTFFRHKDIYKYTWSARGSRSVIDYVLTNKKTSPLVKDTRAFRRYGINTDHFMLVSRINIPQKMAQKQSNNKAGKRSF
jgi:exonuclease III